MCVCAAIRIIFIANFRRFWPTSQNTDTVKKTRRKQVNVVSTTTFFPISPKSTNRPTSNSNKKWIQLIFINFYEKFNEKKVSEREGERQFFAFFFCCPQTHNASMFDALLMLVTGQCWMQFLFFSFARYRSISCKPVNNSRQLTISSFFPLLQRI